MTVYFDAQRHIICKPYTAEHLHRMAQLLGIKRCWYHARPYPHYDLPKRFVWSPLVKQELGDNNVDVQRVTPRELLTIIKAARV